MSSQSQRFPISLQSANGDFISQNNDQNTDQWGASKACREDGSLAQSSQIKRPNFLRVRAEKLFHLLLCSACRGPYFPPLAAMLWSPGGGGCWKVSPRRAEQSETKSLWRHLRLHAVPAITHISAWANRRLGSFERRRAHARTHARTNACTHARRHPQPLELIGPKRGRGGWKASGDYSGRKAPCK